MVVKIKPEFIDGSIICCPVCDFEYSHIKEVYTLLGDDEHEAKCYAGTQVKGKTNSRRSAIAIVFEGECGHVWEMRIQQHKGNNHVEDVTLDVPNSMVNNADWDQ